MGSCNSNRGITKIFKFGFEKTSGHTLNFMRKEKVEKFGSGAMYTTKPTSIAPIGEAFKQNLSVDYCGSAATVDKELNIKIVDIKQTEI